MLFTKIIALKTLVLKKVSVKGIRSSFPNFSDSVGSAAKIQTLTPNATKCLISFPSVAILTASCLN